MIPIQKCGTCNTPFKWIKILKANWFYSTIDCERCGTGYKITFPSRFICAIFIILPMWIYGLFLSPFDNVFIILSVCITIAIIGSLFTPFLVKYKKVTKVTL
ncbi:TIGR04104 family putative zinc finger protein [Cytobacillus pseudoceanisediminis]|uniref:TIGR04104 family putative zinc finger protein n=1 Tax=Cytobacillus pseudoceanisediminis TaxID=3051614 RepID=UPI003CC7417F